MFKKVNTLTNGANKKEKKSNIQTYKLRKSVVNKSKETKPKYKLNLKKEISMFDDYVKPSNLSVDQSKEQLISKNKENVN